MSQCVGIVCTDWLIEFVPHHQAKQLGVLIEGA